MGSHQLQMLAGEAQRKLTIRMENPFELKEKSNLRVKRLIEQDWGYKKDPTYS